MTPPQNWFWEIAIPAASALAGSYFGGYLAEKGRNLATHEDIEKLQLQTAVLTETTKTIEASIGDKVWDRQRGWEMKRDAIIKSAQSLEQTCERWREVAVMYNLSGATEDSKKLVTFDETNTKFLETLTILGLVCGSGPQHAFKEVALAMTDSIQLMLKKRWWISTPAMQRSLNALRPLYGWLKKPWKANPRVSSLFVRYTRCYAGWRV